jgi:hypothetical protein
MYLLLSYYSLLIYFIASPYLLLVYSHSPSILSSFVAKLALNSSNNWVFFVYVLSNIFYRSVEVYIFDAMDLSKFSKRSCNYDTCTLVVDAALRSDRISYLFSVMPTCIS